MVYVGKFRPKSDKKERTSGTSRKCLENTDCGSVVPLFQSSDADNVNGLIATSSSHAARNRNTDNEPSNSISLSSVPRDIVYQQAS